MKKQFYKWVFVLLGGPILFIKSLYGQSSQVLPEFDQIIVSDQVQVELVIADRHSLYLEGAMPELTMAKVVNRTLTLTAENANANKVKVFTKKVILIEATDAARIETVDTLIGEQLLIKGDGQAMIKVPLSIQKLTVELDGASQAIVSGIIDQAIVKTDGASNYKAALASTRQLTIETDGASKATVWASESITAKADGMSKIMYSGNPQTKGLSIDGLAKIQSMTIDTNQTRINGAEDNEPEISSNGDTTRLKFGKKRLTIIDEGDDEPEGKAYGADQRKHDLKSVWGGFELGVQGFTNNQLNFNIAAPYDFMTSDIGKSWFFGLNFPEFDAHLIQNKLAFTTGFGLLWNNIRFDGNEYLTPNIDSFSSTASLPGVNLTKNKLYTFDLTAPLLIKWAPGRAKKEDGGFHIAAGTIIHYVAISRVVTETTSNGYKQRTELKDDFNINPFRVDATLRVGYDWFRLFANYSLTPYFNDSKAPDLRMFSAGITLIGF
ncbi:MAG: DUF2807 domain-containing protein [Bacteroidia bacterium]|jgi:hypothetical protein|nr:DUF2807 domain-containing protein [Bacteroidia bacterium]